LPIAIIIKSSKRSGVDKKATAKHTLRVLKGVFYLLWKDGVPLSVNLDWASIMYSLFKSTAWAPAQMDSDSESDSDTVSNTDTVSDTDGGSNSDASSDSESDRSSTSSSSSESSTGTATDVFDRVVEKLVPALCRRHKSISLLCMLGEATIENCHHSWEHGIRMFDTLDKAMVLMCKNSKQVEGFNESNIQVWHLLRERFIGKACDPQLGAPEKLDKNRFEHLHGP